MTAPLPLRDLLIDRALSAIAKRGLENISLRTIAADAGVSTTAIVHNFGNKDGLLRAAMAEALERERRFHGELRVKLGGHRFGHLNFSELVAAYVEQRARYPGARVWSEFLFKSKQVDGTAAALLQWYAIRRDFWRETLESEAADMGVAPILVTYVTMEEVYAYIMSDSFEYRLLLRETVRALTSASFAVSVESDRDESVSLWLNARPARFPPPDETNSEALPGRLLSFAVAEILDHGIEALNQRRLAAKAKTSSSMIVYHFGDMASFVNQAIWQAILYGVPGRLNPYAHRVSPPMTGPELIATLEAAIAPRTATVSAGFYVSASRLSGQAALLAARQPELTPLIEHLRTIEGLATYRAYRAISPSRDPLERARAAAFGAWIKGEAILNQAMRAEGAGPDVVSDAVARIFGARAPAFPH